jgi:predicted DNA-binding protein (MmcQ/YjbR family)
MTPEDFRHAALELAGALEGSHQGHADFRVNGKVFATLGWPTDDWAMVKLEPTQQEALCRQRPDAFSAASGAWGRNGSTLVRLAEADEALVRSALTMARQGVLDASPKKR